MTIAFRPERAGDEEAIRALTARAFAGQAHSDGSEPHIIDRLRELAELSLSLVAEESGRIVGHIAFSPVSISTGQKDWYGIGPVSVEPARQGKGTGSLLIRTGIEAMRNAGARGFVLLGDPAFYSRFGFRHDPRLFYPGPPAQYFQCLLFNGKMPSGEVRYSRAFG